MAEFALLHHHLAAADVTILIAEHIGYLQLHALHGGLGGLQLLAEIPVEILQHIAPLGLAAFNLVQLRLHVVGEFQIHDVGEALLHQAGDHLAQGGGAQVLALFDHIVVGGNGGNGGSVGGGAADALFLHGPDQRGLGKAGGGLGELLVRQHLLQIQLLALAEAGQGVIDLAALLVPGFLVHGGIALELHLGIVGLEGITGRIHLHGHIVIDGVGHLAGGEAAPDQPVEPVLLLAQVLAHHVGAEVHVGGADGLMGVLGAGLGFEMPGLAGVIVFAIVPDDISAGGGKGFLRKTEGVGTHVGNEAHAALAAELHAFIELLGDGHGAPGRHAQAAGGLLLQGGGNKGGCGRLLLLPTLDAFHSEGGLLRLANDGVDLRLAFQLLLFIALAEEAGVEAGGRFPAIQAGIQQPILLAVEAADLLLPVHHHAGGHGLDPAGGQAGFDLAPQEGRQLIAHDPVQNAAGLLGIDQVLVDAAGVLDALGNHLFGDLIEGDPLGLVIIQLQQFLQMPGDGLALPVRVRGQVDGLGGLGLLLQFTDQFLFITDGDILGLKAMLNIHAHFALGQVPQVTHGGGHLIVAAQVFLDGLGFRRGLDDYQVLRFCHCVLLNALYSDLSFCRRCG